MKSLGLICRALYEFVVKIAPSYVESRIPNTADLRQNHFFLPELVLVCRG